METITSRALLIAGVGRAAKQAEQTSLYLTPMHVARDELVALITNIRADLRHLKFVAQQLPSTDRWKTFLNYIVAKLTLPFQPWQRIDLIAMVG